MNTENNKPVENAEPGETTENTVPAQPGEDAENTAPAATGKSTAAEQPAVASAPPEAPAPAPVVPVDDDVPSQVVTFANKRRAGVLSPPLETPAASIVDGLKLASQPEALLLMLGGVENLNSAISARLVQLFSRGIARVLVNINAVMLDNGRNAGAIQMMGQGVADRGHNTTLIGVAPAGCITLPNAQTPPAHAEPLEPNHANFVLTPGQTWGDETETLIDLAGTLAGTQPMVVLLVAGGDVAKKQVLRAVRRDWPVVVLKESGGLADDIAALAEDRPTFIEDADLAEIIVDGRLYFIQSSGPISAFERLLEQLLNYQEKSTVPTTLELVWKRFAQYDQSANRQQHDFSRMQQAILVLGVVATLLAIIQGYYKNFAGDAVETDQTLMVINWALYLVLLLLPISVSVLIAASNRFSAGNKWVLLRAGAESLKKEIYRYRTRIDIYSDQQSREVSREMQLHRKEESISRKLMQTEVNVAALKKYDGPIPPKYGAAEGDDGLSFLTPERYMKYRLEDQLNYYQGKTLRLEKRMRQLQWLIYIFGGVGTLLVAIGQEIWIAFTTALVTALSTYMEYRQIETTLMRYNQTAAELTSLRSWWIALSAEEQANPANFSQLVDQTETTIHSEHAAWVQEMQDSMAELRAAQQSEKNSAARDRQVQAKSTPAAE